MTGPKNLKQKKMAITVLATVLVITNSILLFAAKLPTSKTAEQEILEQKAAEQDQVQAQNDTVPMRVQEAIARLPEDTTLRFTIREMALEGNTLFKTEQLLSKIPAVYNASPTSDLDPYYLYDLRPLQSLAAETAEPIEISARSIQGLTQYILSVYQKKNYAGIYVYVPATAFEQGQELENGILPIHILEAPVSAVTSAYYDVNNVSVDGGYLDVNMLEKWSPAEEGKVVNRKKMNDFLNLLNRNPDRYLSATISQGADSEALAVSYNVYEANPWHFFAQVDNSGTRDVRWTPRFGVINTNLLGYDDILTAIYQVPLDSSWDDEYSIYGSYDFPVMGPKLRLNLFAGYNEFAIHDSGLINFLGRGEFYGGRLRYNAFQKDGWFFDVLGGLNYQRSKVTPSLFPDDLTTNIWMFTWNYGVELSKTDDMSDTKLSYTQERSIDTSDKDRMDDARTGPGPDPHFVINTISARHSRYLCSNKVERVTASMRWIDPDDRLAPAKMTSFGGMYSVRGYDDYEITTDGGIFASVQYEYDLVRKSQVELYDEQTENDKLRKPFLKKLAPVGFVDYGLAKIEDPTASEHYDQELCSVGGGVIVELSDHFTGTVYYGYPLINTDNTRTGKGRLNAGFLIRW